MINFEEYKKLVTNTRCVRRFKKDITISKKELIEIIDLTRTISSSKNMQPLKYIAISNEDIKKEVYKPLQWAAHLKDWNQSEDEQPSAYILMINDTLIDGFAMIDAGISLQTIMLGATAKGYDACTLASIDKVAYKKLFKLPDHLEPMLIIALGIKDEEIEVVETDDNTNYYRDEKGTHFVPKRKLEDILINAY